MKVGDHVKSTTLLDDKRTHHGSVVKVERGTRAGKAWELIDVRHDADCCHFEGFKGMPRGRVTRSASLLWELSI